MLRANYFDGRSTRVRAVNVSMVGEDLVIAGEDIHCCIPFARVTVDERLGRAPRRLRLKDGAFCEVRDLDALDEMLSSTAHRDGWVDRMQRHLPFVLFSFVVCAALAVAAYEWGLPWAAAWAAHNLPPSIGKTLSAQTLKLVDGKIFVPSKIAEDRRQVLSAKFHALRLPEGGTSDSELLFRGSPQLGANAFTLPDGTIIVLDDLLATVHEDPQVLAVFAHELGHAHGRHSLQLLLQSSAVGAFWTLYVGDISSLLAAAPAALVEARYSQELERAADDYAAALLINNGMSPALLAEALGKLAQSQAASSADGYLSSHPTTDERMRHLQQLAASFKE
ncbi:MAG: peptidase family protein [Gammaproteobacteria bacterium]|nr:peptidase family protein [Gammaproteobacteria bacterium]